MKDILIIARGNLANKFLSRINKIKNIIHNYYVIAYDENSAPKGLGENFTISYFDSTSLKKLKSVVKSREFDRCMIITDDEFDAKESYFNLKEIDPDLELYLLDRWGFGTEFKADNHLKIINSMSIITSRLIGFLPDSPVYADNIGIGKGEIMEVKIPIGSSFAYKKVGLLSQAKYKIPMIYRHNTYIITNYNTMILPNDSILVVGEPSALRSVYASIKRENGQFPSPFGLNIYLFLDMKTMSEEELNKLIEDSKSLNKILKNHKIYIKVINPTIGKIFDKIKALGEFDEIEVVVSYSDFEFKNSSEDIEKFQIGLIVTNNKFFDHHKVLLHELNVPVLSVGVKNLSQISKSVVISDGSGVTEESSIVFDVSSQFGFDVYLYYFNQTSGSDDKFITHYKNLSKLFKKNLVIIDEWTKNPIVSLENQNDFLQFIPFSEKILHKRLTSGLSKDLDRMYYKLSGSYQLFIPSDFKYDDF